MEVTTRLQAAGFQALWAGGCVRDQLLGKRPKDYDVATDATPDQIRDLFGRKRTLPLGAVFGVITVIGPKSSGNIEVATFRKDTAYSDGRHPDSVEFSTAEMDAQRRDFTINGLFYDPLKDEIIDYVGGRQDLNQKVVRAIGNPAERITEDKLRMLRAVRFASNLNFELDSETLETIRLHAGEICIVSAERVAVELQRMLVNKNRCRAVELMYESGLLKCIIPEITDSFKNASSRMATLDRLKRLSGPDLTVALVALLRTAVDPDGFARVCKRLKLPNLVTGTGKWILEHIETLSLADQHPWSLIQPLLIHKAIPSALELLAVEDGTVSAITFIGERLEWSVEQLNPAPLLNGEILRTQGFRPGPQFRQILDEIRRAQLDGEISSTEEAIDLARTIV